jgi:hypothetical protein
MNRYEEIRYGSGEEMFGISDLASFVSSDAFEVLAEAGEAVTFGRPEVELDVR